MTDHSQKNERRSAWMQVLLGVLYVLILLPFAAAVFFAGVLAATFASDGGITWVTYVAMTITVLVSLAVMAPGWRHLFRSLRAMRAP